MADSYLTRAVSSSGNQKTYTVSVWVKQSSYSTGSNTIFGSDVEDDGANYGTLSIESDGLLKFINMTSSSLVTNYQSNRKLLDTTSWYHIVLRVDTTQSTAGDRIRLYVNGEQITSWAYSTTPNQDTDTGVFKSGNATLVGARHGSSSQNFWNGNMAHMHIVEGQSYAPTVFGENDSTTGEWKPILSPSVTYSADNSAFLKFENSGALGTDSSGQSNDFTVGGSLKQSISTTSNNFATFDINNGQCNVIQAGTGLQGNGGSWRYTAINYAMLKGKWYAEFKCVSGTYRGIGFFRHGGNASADLPNTQSGMYVFGEGYFYKADSKELSNNNSETAYGSWSAIADGDILMLALDLDNGKAWYGVNGTWNNTGSGVGVPNTGAYAHQTFTTGTGNFWGVVAGVNSTYDNPVIHANFGEGRFGTTALSSANNDNNSNGTFEYAPPAGFYSICTKNIKDYG